MSVAQATILLQFNDLDVDRLTIGELQEKTWLPQQDLKTALFHLCKPKIRLLDKQVKKATFDDKNE